MLNTINRKPEVQNENWLNSMPARGQQERYVLYCQLTAVFAGRRHWERPLQSDWWSAFKSASAERTCFRQRQNVPPRTRPRWRNRPSVRRAASPRRSGPWLPGETSWLADGLPSRTLGCNKAECEGLFGVQPAAPPRVCLLLAHFLPGFFNRRGSPGSKWKPSRVGSITDFRALSAAIFRRTSSSAAEVLGASGAVSIPRGMGTVVDLVVPFEDRLGAFRSLRERIRRKS
jgi:hypothetical protein